MRIIQRYTPDISFFTQNVPIKKMWQVYCSSCILSSPATLTAYWIEKTKSLIHLPHQMGCKTAQCSHLYPARRPSGSLPPLTRCQCGSTGYSRRTCQCQLKRGLIREEKRGNCGETLSLENFIVSRTIFKYFFNSPH